MRRWAKNGDISADFGLILRRWAKDGDISAGGGGRRTVEGTGRIVERAGRMGRKGEIPAAGGPPLSLSARRGPAKHRMAAGRPLRGLPAVCAPLPYASKLATVETRKQPVAKSDRLPFFFAERTRFELVVHG